MKRAVATLLAALCLSAAAGAAPATALKAGVFEPARPAPAFVLRGSDGGDLTLARYRGKLVLLVFGFTNCAAVCPTTLATLAQTRQALGPDAASVQVIFVTVDPERDDPARMKAYLAAFDPGFVGGGGRPEVLAAMRRDYGIAATKVPMGGSYAVDHTSSTFLIDRDGRLRAMMPYGREARDYVHDLRLLLAQ